MKRHLAFFLIDPLTKIKPNGNEVLGHASSALE